MIRISKTMRNELERVGLIKYKKIGYNAQDPNLVVTNREHVGKNAKTYYVVEEPEILIYLQLYDELNIPLQRIRQDQVKYLLDNNIIDENMIQKPKEYRPNAIVFLDDEGQYRCKKVTAIMVALGYWKANKKS